MKNLPSQLDIKYVGILPNTVKVLTFVNLIWNKLKVVSKVPEELPNFITNVVIIPYIDWLDEISQKDVKYRNILLLENTWWLTKMLDKSFVKIK